MAQETGITANGKPFIYLVPCALCFAPVLKTYKSITLEII